MEGASEIPGGSLPANVLLMSPVEVPAGTGYGCSVVSKAGLHSSALQGGWDDGTCFICDYCWPSEV